VLSLGITKSGNVSVTIYDASGRKIQKIADGYKQAGTCHIDISAGSLSPGVYFLKGSTPTGEFTKKLTIMK